MGTEWSEMHDIVIGKHKADEAFMAADFPVWLKGFRDKN
jgi:hypothetical protein